MYSFEGDFKRTPQQSFGGASKKEEKRALLERTQEERRKRELHRKEIHSATLLQSFLRGCKVRAKVRDAARLEYDRLSGLIDKGQLKLEDETTLNLLLRLLLYHFNLKYDSLRLVWLCQQLIKNQKLVCKLVFSKNTGLFQVNNLLSCCCRYLGSIASSNQPLAVPMRMLEIYTSLSAYKHTGQDDAKASDVLHRVLLYLIDHGYYQSIMEVIEGRIPASIEYTVVPPTPLSSSMIDLIIIPLSVVNSPHASLQFRNRVLRSLCREMFCSSYPPQISHFILPCLAHRKAFPFAHLLNALLPENMDHVSKGGLDLQGMDWDLTLPASPWLLGAILNLSEQYLESMNREDLYNYLMVLFKLVPQLQVVNEEILGDDSESEEEDMDLDDQIEGSRNITEVRKECLRLLNQPQHVQGIISTLGKHSDATTLTAVCTVCHTLMAHNKLFIHKTRLLYSLAFNPEFLRKLWYTTASVSTQLSTGSKITLLQMLGRGMQMRQRDIDRIVPLLSLFCSLFSHTLLSLHDDEFYGENVQNGQTRSMPFQVGELVPMSQVLRDACLGLIELAHPETRPAMKEDYKKAFQSVGVMQQVYTAQELHKQLETWAFLFKVMVQLVKMLYSRDCRRRFCPDGHWLSKHIAVYADKPSQIYKAHHTTVRRPFGSMSTLKLKKDIVEEEGPLLSTYEVRQLTVLSELPYVVPFEERVKIFHKLILQDKMDHQGDMRHLAGGPSINIMVRRNYLYEDAFEKLSPENEPNMKLKTQVQLVNFAGLDEAGIDGGGIFREFMSELIKTSFDPNRGLMKYTVDRLLYPNPAAKLVMDNYTAHYFFMGRILGKAIYESMLVELPFASFFLSKILSRTRQGDVDIHHLQSMDPEMYKNLLFLKYYDGDVSDLELDFSVVNNDLGETKIEELKPGGTDIRVTNSNRIEYIYLMADYRLNKQIRTHVNAFRQGLADVINLEWLRMFDHRELQTLISGALIPIDISDLRRHTNYSGGYHEDHAVILNFWSIVGQFTDEQKRHLLKFVTSCSRPPLLGFKELYPAFCIHYAGQEDRLPTASTCMNLLKLPEFKDEKTLREKLLYAIESGSGFELS